MKITAILCNYNGEAYLKESIRSVLSQTRPADEFIIVDDGSSDTSDAIIQSFAESHPDLIRYERHGINKGQAAGFNTSIRAAIGDWLCFIDSDDAWFADKLKRVEKEVTNDEKMVLFQHRLQVITDDRPQEEIIPVSLAFGDFWSHWHNCIFFPMFTPTSGVAIKADIAKQILPVPEHLKHSADSFLTRSVICHGSVGSIPEPLGYYRRHDANAVHGNQSHNAYDFYQKEVAPYLHQYYVNQGLKSPINKVKSNIILDLSIRKIINKARQKLAI